MSCLSNRAPQVTSTNLWTWMRPDLPQIQEYSTFPTPVDKMFIKHIGFTPHRFFQYDNSLVQLPPEQRWVEMSPYLAGFQVPLIPTGANPLQITDITEGHAANPSEAHNGIEGSIFLVYITDPDPKVAGPMLMTDRGLIVKKDLMAGGFLDSGQGTLWLNYGLVGKPELSSPPVIQLMSAIAAYPSGAQFRDISPDWYEEGQLFTLTSDYYWPRKSKTYPAGKYRWEGNGQNGDWIKNDSYTGYYDTLYLCKDHFTTPAHLNIGNLIFGDRGTTGADLDPKIVLSGSINNHDNLFLRKADGTSPAHLNAGTIFAQHLYARGTGGASKGAHLSCNGENDFHLSTFASNSTPYWKIGLGDGTGALDTSKIYLASEGDTISVYNGNFRVNANYKIQANDYWDSNGGASATFHGNVTGTAAKIRVLGSNPSPTDGEIWLVSS
jgi:hypothetical protein